MYILRKRAWKLKSVTFMTTFQNFTLKIETGCPKRVVQPIFGHLKCQLCLYVCTVYVR